MTTAAKSQADLCDRCGRDLGSRSYEMRSADRRVPHCLKCSLMFPSILRRSLAICLIVGTLLTAINQGNFILAGDFQWAMTWKIPLTYAVPFSVATVAGLLNARSQIGS